MLSKIYVTTVYSYNCSDANYGRVIFICAHSLISFSIRHSRCLMTGQKYLFLKC